MSFGVVVDTGTITGESTCPRRLGRSARLLFSECLVGFDRESGRLAAAAVEPDNERFTDPDPNPTYYIPC